MLPDLMDAALGVLQYLTVGALGAGIGSAATTAYYRRKGLL